MTIETGLGPAWEVTTGRAFAVGTTPGLFTIAKALFCVAFAPLLMLALTGVDWLGMVMSALHCLQRACLPASDSGAENLTPQFGQQKTRFMKALPS